MTELNIILARVLSTFYCNKLEDAGTVIPALKGIQSLVKLQTCSALEVQSILRRYLPVSPIKMVHILIIYSMFQYVRPKALVQSIRFIVFSILDSLVANHRDGLYLTAGF